MRWLVALVLLCCPGALAAQGAGAITARATVSTTGLTAGSIQDLDFGAVIPGTPTTVAPRNGAGAGQFRISGTPNAEVQVTFALPAALTVGANSIPVTFGANSGCQVGFTAALRFICGFFNPQNPLIQRLPNLGAPWNTLHIWLGGVATPAVGQQPGIYTGFVTLTVAYTGN